MQSTPTTATTFQVGDRVYLVSDPMVTGTVREISTLTDRIRVDWDCINYNEPPVCYCPRFDWWDAAQLDYWTRPESAVEAESDLEARRRAN